MRKRDKTCAKATPEEPKREQRMVCLMSEEEQRIVDRYLEKYKITVYNPQLFLAHQTYDALFTFRLFGCCFRTRFISLSHISCKISFTSVNTKQKKRIFA